MILAIAAPVFAKDAPVVINGHLSGEINHQTSNAQAPTSVPQPSTMQDTKMQDTAKDNKPSTTTPQEVYWGYVMPKPRPVKRIHRVARTAPPWKYKPTNKRYQPRPTKTYRPKPRRGYTPKASFDYHPKANWSYTPRVWNRY